MFSLNTNDNSLTVVNEEVINTTTDFFIEMLHNSIELQSTTIENVETTAQGDELLISFSLMSNNIPYPETSLADVGQLAPQAFSEWAGVRQQVENWITGDNLTISTNGFIYISDSSSVVIGTAEQTCPSGRRISLSNNFICGECVIFVIRVYMICLICMPKSGLMTY